MRIHEAHQGTKRQKRKRKGRGPSSGSGKTAGRGQNGFKSRSGNSTRRGYEGGQMPLFRRMPKRGFSNARFKKEPQTVNVSALAVFEAGSSVGPQELVDRRVIRKLPDDGVKILGDGELTVKLTVKAHAFSASARQKIEAAGGSVETL